MIEKIARKIAWSLPDNVLYWCVIRAAVMHCPSKFLGDLTALEMLEKIRPIDTPPND